MKPSRPSRSNRTFSALVALVSMLFMQLAVAGYACPGMSPVPTVSPAAMMMDGHVMGSPEMDGHAMTGKTMPGCESMNMVPSLCHANAHVQHQSLDKHELPPVAVFIPVLLLSVFADRMPATDTITLLPDAPLLARATSPPVAIRNCCFRI